MVERSHSLKRTGGAVKSMVRVGCIAVSLAVVGCGALWNHRPIPHEGRPRLDLPWCEALGDIDAFQTVTHDNVTVYHPEDLAPQAQWFAELTARQVSHIREETGFQSRLPKVNVYMKRPQEHTSRNTRLSYLNLLPGDGTFEFILFVRPGDESCEGIVAANTPAFPCTVMHEYVEDALMLLLDYRWKTFWGREKEKFQFTRWFREGYAEYAAFLTYKMTVFDDSFARERFPIGVYQLGLKRHPFSSLARVGKDLFTWHQYYENPTPYELNPNLPHVGNTNIDYYAAALGLFLVIEDRYGREAIKEIVENINRLEDRDGQAAKEMVNRVLARYARHPKTLVGDGEAVKEIVNSVLGTDIVRLVEDFRFPQTGCYMTAFWPGHAPGIVPPLDFPTKEGLFVELVGPDSPAHRAGIRKGDVVVSLDGQRTVTNPDFEFALYERMHQKDVTVGIWRQGVGTISIQLKLEE